jgi:hypothetical protein
MVTSLKIFNLRKGFPLVDRETRKLWPSEISISLCLMMEGTLGNSFLYGDRNHTYEFSLKNTNIALNFELRRGNIGSLMGIFSNGNYVQKCIIEL